MVILGERGIDRNRRLAGFGKAKLSGSGPFSRLMGV
jgi:hypothetical protein